MSTAVAILTGLAPLYVLAFGCVLVWWDLRRRDTGPPVPSDQQVERFGLEKLELMSAEITGLRARQSGMLATVEETLEKSVEERRSAAGMKSRAQRVLNDKRHEELQPANALEAGGGSEEEALRAIDEQLGPGPMRPTQ